MSIQDCCNKAKQDMQLLQGRAKAASDTAVLPALPAEATKAHPELIEAHQIKNDLVDKPAGAWIDVHGTKVPSLATLLAKVATPLNAGFSEWQWHNNTGAQKTTLTLPQAPNGAKALIALNGVKLVDTQDYTLAGTQLTFTHPLDPKDWVIVKTYGA